MKHNELFENILDEKSHSEIKKMIPLFKKNKDFEFEISFKKIDYPNYFRIINHYVNNTDSNDIEMTDMLDITILLSNNTNYRVTMLGSEQADTFISKFSGSNNYDIQKYLLGLSSSKTIIIIYKNRKTGIYVPVDELDMNIKLVQEENTKSKPITTGNEKILYRYKRNRISFSINDNVRIDTSEVQQSYSLSNLTTRFHQYEIEMEVINRDISILEFWNQTYNILKIIQNSNYPITKSEAKHVIEEYSNLLNLKNITHLDTRNVISLEAQHIVKFIPNKYGIIDKANGERYILFSIREGVYLISMNLVVKKTKFIFNNSKYLNMILDGELINLDKITLFMAFDVIYENESDKRYNEIFRLPNRINTLNEIIDNAFGNLIPFADFVSTKKDLELNEIKKFYTKELKRYCKDSCEIFMYADLIWKLYVYDELPPYKLDGIIYTPINAPYMIKTSPEKIDSIPMEYKWKQPKQNSIDFYIQFEKDSSTNEDAIFIDNSVNKNTNNSYKICRLYVGLVKGGQEKPIPFKVNGVEQKAVIYWVDGETKDKEGNVINDQMVVEFIYDSVRTDLDDAFKWIPLVIRNDKTESVMKYKKRYGNNSNIADRIWKTIINPINEEDIASLADSTSYQKQMDLISKRTISNSGQSIIYYQKKSADAIGMRAFNNWIKSNIITTYCKNHKKILDISCGRGGDLLKFITVGVDMYVGVDIDNNGLYTINDSAFNRYKHFKKTIKNVPPMHFINADARGLFNVKSQENIITNMSDDNKNLIKTYLSSNQKYDVINCQFALHYFLSDELSWNNFCKNLNDHLELNGYFLITCFDGKLIHDKLIDKSKITISYTDNKGKKVTFFELQKIYSDTDINNIGLAVDIYNSLISNEGTNIREYLVFPNFLIESLKEKCGLELIETDSFFNLYNIYKNYFSQNKIGNKDDKRYADISDFYLMMDQKYRSKYTTEQIDIATSSYKMTMMNRYYVFKKKVGVDLYESSRIVGINHRINVGKILTPYFHSNKLIIDIDLQSTDANKIYHKLRESNKYIKPHVYLIKHIINEDDFEKEKLIKNKFILSKAKKGIDSMLLLIYKSPEKIFYPIYYESTVGPKYLLNSEKVIDDIDLLIKLTNEHL